MTSPRILFTGASPRGWHRLQTVLECPQKFAWEYRYGREGFDDPKRIALLSAKLKQDEEQKSNSPALIRGTLIHLGLAHYLKGDFAAADALRAQAATLGVEFMDTPAGATWRVGAGLSRWL